MIRLLTLFLCLIISFHINGEIFNGCAVKLVEARQSLANLQALKSKYGNSEKIAELYDHLRRVKLEIRRLTLCAERTERLLESFSELRFEFEFDPSNVMDASNRLVDVYVLVLDIEEMGESVFGMTQFSQDPNNLDSPRSMYGPGTVMVQIRYCAIQKMLRYLIHEFAHIQYQIPNLAAYIKYYRQTYCNGRNHHLGHHLSDSSSMLVKRELQRFAVRDKPASTKSRKTNMLTFYR